MKSGLKPKHRRLVFVVVAMLILAAAAGLILSALKENIVFFYSPSDIAAKPPTAERRIRVGGLVEADSVEKPGGGVVRFRITDTAASVPVVFRGILPDLFREGQGVIAEGKFADGVFAASEVLAKHDETYMPREVVDALKKTGQWKPDEKAKGSAK
ncbi:MAG: cytochrome c maturation protein CcmE [Alphaproteobacteria bacterium]|nr:cytochrome c maturation protein CcmE [Alphaproteobacteria bacterium]